MAYDTYRLLPALVRDSVGLETSADYDYRALQPGQVTDVNGGTNHSSFTPLGLLRESWVRGNAGEGDQTWPSVVMEYDFDAFTRERQPISVRPTRRLHHDIETDVPMPERDETIASTEYSDGFGRLLQTRVQGEDVRFGDPVFGEGVIPADQEDHAATVRQVVGTENTDRASPNVVVSGWQRYDNKGRVVEKFEPFFAVGWAYSRPATGSFGEKVTMYYDPRGQVVRTVNPDGSEQLVIYGIPTDLDDPPVSPSQTASFAPTAWEVYTYDTNDSAGRTHGMGAQEYRHHWNTPAHIAVDGLGRTILSVARQRDRPVSSTSPIPAVTEFRTRSVSHPVLWTIGSAMRRA